jgi:hypothetical protein
MKKKEILNRMVFKNEVPVDGEWGYVFYAQKTKDGHLRLPTFKPGEIGTSYHYNL